MNIRFLRLSFNNAAEDVRVVPVDYKLYSVGFHWDNNREVRCSGEYCTYCKEGAFIHTRIMIPLYSESERCIKYWPRSNFSIQYIDNLYNRCDGHPERYTFKLIRHGHKFDKFTTYEFVNLGEANPNVVIPEVATPEEVFSYLFAPVEEETA